MFIRIPYRKVFRKLEDNGINKDHPFRFLNKSRGVIHIGANSGQERGTYSIFGINVAWVEPVPHIFKKLEKNIYNYKKQVAFQYLITDKDNEEKTLNIANNESLSSSIFTLDKHQLLFPNVTYQETIRLKTSTLDTIIRKERLSPKKYDTLVMDVEGAELMVLKGAKISLKQFKWVFLECTNFDARKGACQCHEIVDFLEKKGFFEERRHYHSSLEGVGEIYNILFTKVK